MAYVSNCGFQELQKRIWPVDTFVDLVPKRTGNLPNSIRRIKARTPLPATALLSKIRKMVSERMRPHRGWRGFTTPARAAKK